MPESPEPVYCPVASSKIPYALALSDWSWVMFFEEPLCELLCDPERLEELERLFERLKDPLRLEDLLPDLLPEEDWLEEPLPDLLPEEDWLEEPLLLPDLLADRLPLDERDWEPLRLRD